MAVELITLTPTQSLGIPVALVGSVFLALGAEFQHRGVNKVDAASERNGKQGLGAKQLFALIRRPSWVLGTIMLALAILFQLFSLFLAPLTVVQPLGALALVITAIVNSRVNHVKLSTGTIRSIAFCVVGIGLFVTVAALTTSSLPIDERQLLIVLIILLVVVSLLGVAFLVYRKRLSTVFYIVAAGILFGFVATLAKVIIDRVNTLVQSGFHPSSGDWLTFLCLFGIIAAGLLGSYFVQTAYSSGPPDLVVAGLTVIDPIVGVTIGIVVLGEAASAPWWAAIVFVIAGLIAIYGVVSLSRRDPSGHAAPKKAATAEPAA